MTNEATYLTPEGAEKLRLELTQLKGPDRVSISLRLREAIEMGDLSENADYHKAKEDQAFLEGRIQDLEFLLQSAQIIEHPSGKKEQVTVGTTITIQEADDEPETYYMVGTKEADPKNGRISNESPIGKALMDKRVGDYADVETPGGKIRLKILKIE